MIDTIQEKKEISRKLKERAIFEGFAVAGIASIPGSSRVKLRTNALERWLSNNYPVSYTHLTLPTSAIV